MNYILASASPRRKELLQQIGLSFEVIPACKEEKIRFEKPEDAVMDLSWQKAMEIAEKRAGLDVPEVIIGADTVVVLDGRILGKPKDTEDAFCMLSRLQGNSHKVYTGVTLIRRKRDVCESYGFYEETEVTMYPVSEEERRLYIATGEPMDKAGAYGIQGRGAIFIQKIHGDYNNVVGLPVASVYQELKNKGMLPVAFHTQAGCVT